MAVFLSGVARDQNERDVVGLRRAFGEAVERGQKLGLESSGAMRRGRLDQRAQPLFPEIVPGPVLRVREDVGIDYQHVAGNANDV